MDFVDDLQRVISLPAYPRRIVSLVPSITETLFALGVGERVVGVTDYCTHPPEEVARVAIGVEQAAGVEKPIPGPDQLASGFIALFLGRMGAEERVQMQPFQPVHSAVANEVNHSHRAAVDLADDFVFGAGEKCRRNRLVRASL